MCLYINHQPSYTSLSFGILPIPFNFIVFILSGISGTGMIMAICAKLPRNIIIERIAKSLITIVGVQALFYKPVVYFWGRDLSV